MSDSNVTTLDDATPVEVIKVGKAKAKAADVVAADGTFFNVTFYPTGDEQGDQLIDVGANGYVYRFERGVPKRVPEFVKVGIDQMVVTTYHNVGGDTVAKHTPRFPYSAIPA